MSELDTLFSEWVKANRPDLMKELEREERKQQAQRRRARARLKSTIRKLQKEER